MDGSLGSIYKLKNNIKTKRISSYDKSGGNTDCITNINSGETAVLAQIGNTGIIKHIWITVNCQDPMFRRNVVIRMFWNNEENPSVECPLGDFFGQGWGEFYNYTALPLCASPAGGRALNSYFPMPFLDGARIEIVNQSKMQIDAFYYYIDYEEHESLPDDTGMFHAWWNREITVPEDGTERGENEWCTVSFPYAENKSVDNNYLFADIEGKGHFVGINYYVDCPSTMWYGEGDDMWLIDGENWPGSLHGTGTEDFFNSSWCPSEVYIHPYFGYAKVPEHSIGFLGRTHCYRYFIQDPIYFEKSLHASIEHGHANCLTLDIATVSYWYQTEPHKKMKPLPGIEMRQNMPNIDGRLIHKWRNAWMREIKKKYPEKIIWGDEKLGDNES